MLHARTCTAALILLSSGPLLAGDLSPPAPTGLDAIKRERQAAFDAYAKAAKELPDTPEREKKAGELRQAFDKVQAEKIAAAVALARAEPKSQSAFDALKWVLTNPLAYKLPPGREALRLVTEHHAANPQVGSVVALAGHHAPREDASEGSPLTAALYKAVLDQNADRTARGQVMLALAWQALRKFQVAEYKKGPETDALAAEAERAFEAVVRGYGDCPQLPATDNKTLGDLAEVELYALRHLRVGMVAPEIDGEDLDGTRFRLTDFRGKVTVLVFWASWCDPCMQMVPEERALVARSGDKPFALVGVNGDKDREKARRVAAKERMTWRSFWNGADGPHGPITRTWTVRQWPTTYVLDADGVIRFRDLQGKPLAEAVDRLVKGLGPGKRGEAAKP